MSTFSLKNLAGQLPAVTGDLYTVPAATTAIIKTMTLVNTDSVARAVNLYTKISGGTARRISPVNCSLSSGYLMETDKEYTLGAGDKVQGDAAAANVVDWTISLMEMT